MSANVIEIHELKKYYGKHRGIESVTLSVEEGEIYGFIGPNGAGKSTTIRTLLALVHPTAGHAAIFGLDCIRDAPRIARDVGYLPSEAYYYEHMTVRELLKYSADLYRKDCTKRIIELSGRLNLDLKRKVSELSFGNRKKVGIVGALLHSPKLIILDEPTSGLDPLVQQVFYEILKEENEKGVSILFSSHVLSEVQKICGRVAVLKEGRIIDIQKISTLKEYGYKKIEVAVKSTIPDGYFDACNVAEFRQSGATASFIFHGDISMLLEKLNRLDVVDIFIAEPSLEEIFLHYYKQESRP